MHTLESLLEQSDNLPSLPEIYTRVSSLLDDEDSSAHDIGDAVQSDPTLTAKILKMINSAYFGLPNQVTTISQAVSLLGRALLKQTLMSSVLSEVFRDFNQKDFSMREFWQHSIKTAIIARHLAMQNASIIDHESFFTAGLLHDLGRLILAKVDAPCLLDVQSISEHSEEDITQIEITQIGVSHTQLGAALLQKWGMPSLFIQCALRHHDEEHLGPFAIDTSTVYLANKISNLENTDDESLTYFLSTITNWKDTRCTEEQILIASRLADEQCIEVMKNLSLHH